MSLEPTEMERRVAAALTAALKLNSSCGIAEAPSELLAARAVIRTMRDPTPDMVAAACGAWGWPAKEPSVGYMREAIARAIDAASPAE